MNENAFSFEPDDAARKTSSGRSACPLAAVPDEFWQKAIKALSRKPFRKRHPVFFWLAVLVLVFGGALAIMMGSEEDDGLLSGDRIALVRVRGPIMDVMPTLSWLQEIGRNERVKGVLVRVDSPGGGAAASQELFAGLARLAKTRPVAVSMGSMAASGGLMVSMAGQRIFANASTVTGSIGVRMDIPQLQGLLEKIGVGQETIATAPYKDAGSYLRPLSPDDRKYFEGILGDMHEQFVDIVATQRKLPREKALALASGKIFTGREALALGLVDAVGGQAEAHAWLAEQSGVPMSKALLTRPRDKTWYADALRSLLVRAGEILTGLDTAPPSGDWRSPVFLYQF